MSPKEQSNELRGKSEAEIAEQIVELRREQLELRMALATGQSTEASGLPRLRRSIARAKTVLTEKQRANAQGNAA